MHRPRIRWSWILVPLAAAIAFVLGLIGFREHFHNSGDVKSWFDLFYLTGQLFTMESGAVPGKLPWQLEVARFGAPLVAASAVVAAVFSLFSNELRRSWLRFHGGHVIVCGLGRKGSRLVEELHKEGKRVVVIEPDEHNPGLSRCRALKVVVIPARSDDVWALNRAFVDRADTLIATAGDDSVNIETAVLAHDLAKYRSKGVLRCVAHLTDPALQQILKAHPFFSDEADPFELELVNVYEAGARVVTEQARLPGPGADGGTTRVCIVGLGNFGEAVLRRLLRDWSMQRAELKDPSQTDLRDSAALEIIVVDLSATTKETAILQRFHEYLSGVSLHFIDRDVKSPVFAGPDLAVSRTDQKMHAFFVCFDDDSLATLAAIRIRKRFGTTGPVVVRMTEQAGLAKLINSGSGGCSTIDGICTIGFLDIACMGDLFLGGDNEILARAFHEAYLTERRAAGDTSIQNPSLVPWHELDEGTRQSNRARAADTREQLAKVGLTLTSCPDRPIILHPFSPEQLDALARIEHERWLTVKRDDGWRSGEVRDNARKINPLIKEWEHLEDKDKTFNLATVRRLPGILARADFEIKEVASESLSGGRATKRCFTDRKRNHII